MNRTERDKRGRLMKTKIQKEKDIVRSVFLLKNAKMTKKTVLHSTKRGDCLDGSIRRQS